MAPLNFPPGNLFRAYGYWFLLSSLILSSALLAYYVNSAVSSFVSTLVFYVALNSHQFLYYNVVGSDMNGQIMTISLMSEYSHVRATMSQHFSYLSYPAHHMYALTLEKAYGFESTAFTVETGYVIYFLLFVLSVWVFAYRVGDGFLAYAASISYMILSFVPLNNQFVPQFLALIMLFFLFYTMDREGFGWRAVEGVLFVTLLFSHLVFPLFYLFARTLRPGVTSLLDSYRNDAAYSRMYEILLHPVVLLRRLVSTRTWLPNTATAYVWTAVLWLTYFVKNNPLDVLSTMLAPRGRTAGNPVVNLLSDLGSNGRSSDVAVEPLYVLVPKSLDSAVTWGSRILVLTLFGVLVLSFFANELDGPIRFRDRSVDFRAEVVLASLGLFGVMAVLNTIYGMRVLQVAFLPAALFFYGVRKNRRAVVLLIVCLSLVSPVLLANSYANDTMSAGGNTIGYHETRAGQTLGPYARSPESVVVPPHTPYPVGSLDEMRNDDIRLLVYEERVPNSNLMIYSERFGYYLDYRGLDCRIEPEQRNVIYDNGQDGAQAFWSPVEDPVANCLRGEFQ